MNLFDIIAKLRDRGIDVNNTVSAVTVAGDLETDQAGYEQAMFEITGDLIRTGFPLQAQMYYINFVTAVVSQYSKTEDIDQQQAVYCAKAGTEKYFSVFTSRVPPGCQIEWKTATRAEVAELTKVHAAEYTRPVSKQARAIELLKMNPAATSRELVAMFIDQLKLTPNGAATYLYNCKKWLKVNAI